MLGSAALLPTVKNSAQLVVGVASTSELAPIKQGNFPYDLEPGDFEGKKKYSEWQFVYGQLPTAGTLILKTP